jgi:hypothetical protein
VGLKTEYFLTVSTEETKKAYLYILVRYYKVVKMQKTLEKKDEIIEHLLRRLNRDKERKRDRLEVVYCAHCPEWEVLFEEECPLEELNCCDGCYKLACEKCAEKTGWLWHEEIQKIENPPYYTTRFCPICAAK